MKILSADFIKTNKGYNVAMCMLSDEGASKIKYMEVFETESKLEDIAELIINKFEVLNCDYVTIDRLGIKISSILKDKLGYKVRVYNTCYIEESQMVHMLSKSEILKEFGLELKYCILNNGKLKLHRKEYTDFEYLMVKTTGIANKLLNEITEGLINNKVPLGDINITVNSNTNVLIEDLAKEISRMVSNVYKEIANDNCDKFKDNKNDITNKLNDVLKRLTIKESHKLSMKRVIEDNLHYYLQIERFDLCELSKKELKNINAENEFIYDLIVDIEEIKNMIDEI